ncbi:MAG: YdcH family protein [Acidobacteriaceae bacterium]|nr:YdcH family protein [Acidobacteriaceae bacterium]MBV9498569.1 YdcH family protein [Acidobacteriaceae bacterium]
MEHRTQEEELKAHLLATNEQFRTLSEQHAQLKRQIGLIESKLHVTPEDELEEQRIKKQKLRVKDQMNQIVAQYRHTTV